MYSFLQNRVNLIRYRPYISGCGAGKYLNEEAGTCMECDRGTYQDSQFHKDICKTCSGTTNFITSEQLNSKPLEPLLIKVVNVSEFHLLRQKQVRSLQSNKIEFSKFELVSASGGGIQPRKVTFPVRIMFQRRHLSLIFLLHLLCTYL